MTKDEAHYQRSSQLNMPEKYAWCSGFQWFAFALLAAFPVSAITQTGSDRALQRMEVLRHRLENPAAGDVIVVAHRGCWVGTAENSLAAIHLCVALGVDMIEIDVRSSRDGHLVLMHDETVDRTTDGSGPVGLLTLRELQQLRLRRGAGNTSEDLTDERVPTLEDALRAAKDRVLVNLDIKETLYDQSLQIARHVGSESQLVFKMAADPGDPRLANASFHGKTYYMPIIRECTEDPARFCSPRLQAAVVEYGHYEPVAVEVVNHTDEYLLAGVPAVRELNARLWVNTLPGFAAGRSDERSLVNPDGNWGYLVDHGVNMIQTDRPAELLAYLTARGLRIED